jgi:Chemotaxis protein; stimulates methylation of MCP proteins
MDLKTSNHFFLHPSAVFFSKDPTWVTTVLGSCVAVCFFDSKKCFGGINHFMMPYWNGYGLESPKYGNVAIEQLFLKMLDFGAEKEDIVCKIFGGSEMLAANESVFNVGKRNIELAFRVVNELDILVVSSSTGGKHGRKIHFNTGTGEVWQKYLVKSNSSEAK